MLPGHGSAFLQLPCWQGGHGGDRTLLWGLVRPVYSCRGSVRRPVSWCSGTKQNQSKSTATRRRGGCRGDGRLAWLSVWRFGVLAVVFRVVVGVSSPES